jgi:hypothetical protein
MILATATGGSDRLTALIEPCRAVAAARGELERAASNGAGVRRNSGSQPVGWVDTKEAD